MSTGERVGHTGYSKVRGFLTLQGGERRKGRLGSLESNSQYQEMQNGLPSQATHVSSAMSVGRGHLGAGSETMGSLP